MAARLDGKSRSDLGKPRKYATAEEKAQARREQQTAARKRYRERHTDALRQKSAGYRAANTALCIARTRKWQAENPDRAKDAVYRRKYGLSLADITAMSRAQGGRCLICQEQRPLVVDHCHTKNVFRGLICDRCNVALGCFEDDSQRLKNAIAYLERRDGKA